MSEPIYDENLVNLGYLKRIISETEEGISDEYKNVSRHYSTKPQPPYNKGDIWIDGNIVYTCINSRQIGLYVENDWVTESGAKEEAKEKNKTYLTQPSNYSPGDMWILQSDEDHRAGKKGEILISTAGRQEYDSDDWVNMLGYGNITSINEVAEALHEAINRIGMLEEAIEDGVIVTFYQDTIPEGIHVGDLWYVTGEIEGYLQGKIYRYDGTNWVVLNDPEIEKAFEEANEARIVADGKIQSFYSETEPSQDIGVGDLWIDIANNNKLYRYNGTNWIPVYDTRVDELVTTVETTTERVASIETDLGEINLRAEETTTKLTTLEGQVSDNYTETSTKLAEQKVTVDGMVSEVSEVTSNINTINNNLTTLNETVATTEQRVNEYEIRFEETTKTIDENLQENIEAVKNMAYTFSTDDLQIAKEDDPVNSRVNNSGMRVYSYSELKAIFNDKGSGIQKLIVVESAQLGNLQIVKAIDENGQACTDFHHLVSNIQELTDLEV